VTTIAILGTGMAGCGAAHRLRDEPVTTIMYDQHAYSGGHTASFTHPEGFTFDDGPHVSFTKDARFQALLAENVNHEYQTVPIRLNNYWHGHWITHPVQCNLRELPPELVVKILMDFLAARNTVNPVIRNYADWLIASFGRTFAETFPMEYTKKYWLTDAANMTTDWLEPRIYRPDLEEILLGALTTPPQSKHYVTEFRYPTRGGFGAYVARFLAPMDVRLGHKVVGVDPKDRTLRFEDGRVAPYDGLVSSVPLPELIPMIGGVPDEVREAAGRLHCSSCVLVNVGVAREGVGSNSTMSYFYDADFCFTRLSFPHAMSPHTVPPGASSIQAEVYFSDTYKPLDRKPDEFIEPMIRDLRRCGLLDPGDRILFRNATVAKWANVIFDLEREAALTTVHGFLDEIGIGYCGRYGDWGYMWTDHSFASGERAAETVLKRSGR